MSVRRMREWLRGEIDAWVGDGILTPAQGDTLRARYPVSEAGTPWGVIVFSTLGAMIAGLGVILLFAYNWHAIPKFGKLAIVFGCLAAAHGTGAWLFLTRGRGQHVGEGLLLLGTMLFGAGIWLVAQIYHIEEHYPNAFLAWGSGATLMALAVPSTPQGILAAVLFNIWCVMERTQFDTPRVAAPILIAAVLGPLAWLRRSVVLLTVVIPAFTISLVFTLPGVDRHPWLIFSTVLNLGALWIALRFLVRDHGGFPAAGRVLGFYGWASFYVALFLLCFPELADDLLHPGSDPGVAAFVSWGVQLALVAAAWGWVARDRELLKTGIDPDDPGFELYLVPLIVILVLAGVLFPHTWEGWALSAPCNLVMLGLSVSLMARGCRRTRPDDVAIGTVLLIALTIARYFDLFHDLLLRGFIFLAVGIILFVEGTIYARVKQRRQQPGQEP